MIIAAVVREEISQRTSLERKNYFLIRKVEHLEHEKVLMPVGLYDNNCPIYYYFKHFSLSSATGLERVFALVMFSY
jgi:hypothetical protein